MANLRLNLTIGVVAGVGLWWGGHHVRLAVEERDPLEISCADYLAKKPDAHYLRLTSCEPDFDHVAKATRNGDVTEVYIPLRPIGETGAPHIVLVRNDAAICQLVAHPGNGDQDGVADSLSGPQQGVVQFGWSLSEDERNQLAKLGLGLAPDFMMLDEGAEPHLWLGLAACAASLFAIGRLLGALLRRFRG